jgi:hypothetical protein
MSACIHTGQYCDYAEVRPPAICLKCEHNQAKPAPAVVEMDQDTLERIFQTNVERIAEAGGFRHWHNQNARRSEPGWPDLVMWRGPKVGYPPRLVFAELKKIGGAISDAQQRTAYGLRDAGQEFYFWYPTDLPEIELILK